MHTFMDIQQYLSHVHTITNKDIVFIMDNDVFFTTTCNTMEYYKENDAYTCITTDRYFLAIEGDSSLCSVICLTLDQYTQDQTSKENIYTNLLNENYSKTQWEMLQSDPSLQDQTRVLYLIINKQESDDTLLEVLKNMAMDEDSVFMYQNNLLYIANTNKEDFAHSLVSVCMSEAMTNVEIACSLPFTSLYKLKEAYKECLESYAIHNTFSTRNNIHTLNNDLAKRVIYHLDPKDCTRISNSLNSLDTLDQEEIDTFVSFLHNNLNLAKTARDLYIHRNTLVYRLDKIKSKTGYDVLSFEGSMKLRLHLLLEQKMNQIDE